MHSIGMSKLYRWRRLWVRLMFALTVVSTALWISSKKPVEYVFVPSENSHDTLRLVPRGQTFFHSYPESNRYTSDDTWRPHEFYLPNQMLVNKKHTRSHFHQELPREDIDGADRILLLIKTSMQSVWKQVPTHLFTTLTQFPNAILCSDGPDSVGGLEVVDIISHIDKHQLQSANDLMYYRIHRSLRDKHVYIAPDQVHVSGEESIDKYKHLHMLLHAWEQTKLAQRTAAEGVADYLYATDPVAPESLFDWYILINDDSFLFAPSIIEYLHGLDPSKPLYLGAPVEGHEKQFADSGSGIILSRGVMKQVFDHPEIYDRVDDYTRKAQDDDRGDYVLAKFLDESYGITINSTTSNKHFQGNPVWKVQFEKENWCKEIFSFADQSSRDIELLWEYQRVKPSKLLYVDLYLDFAKPYFPSNAQKNWDNGASTVEYVPSGEYDRTAPYASYTNCQSACQSHPHCMMFRHDSYLHYCGLGINTIGLGRPTIQYQDPRDEQLCKKHHIRCNGRGEGEEMTSGWILSRVRSMRKQLTCDPLYENHLNEGEEGAALDQTEGWWLRAKERYGSGAKDPLV